MDSNQYPRQDFDVKASRITTAEFDKDMLEYQAHYEHQQQMQQNQQPLNQQQQPQQPIQQPQQQPQQQQPQQQNQQLEVLKKLSKQPQTYPGQHQEDPLPKARPSKRPDAFNPEKALVDPNVAISAMPNPYLTNNPDDVNKPDEYNPYNTPSMQEGSSFPQQKLDRPSQIQAYLDDLKAHADEDLEDEVSMIDFLF
jgi:hypothetical protein